MLKLYITLLLALVIFPNNLVSAQCFKTSLYFDGVYNAESTSNDHVDISTYGPMSTIASGASYTIEAWVKRDRISNPGGYERILSKDFIYQFRIIDNQFVGEIGTSSVQTPYPADTLWHHLAFVRNAVQGTLALFIDGQLRATAPDNSTSLANNNAMVSIGARDNGAGEINELWKGNIRWMRVSQVARYLANFTPAESYANDFNTRALWAFNTGEGAVLYDLSSYNQRGTIINASWVTETPTSSPSLSAQSTSLCAGLSTQLTASNCTGSVAWGTGESGNSITVTPYATTTYTARCIGESGCPSNAAEITIEVEGVMPTVSIAANPGTFIQKGESVTFTASITHGGTTPVYQWQKNGVVVGTNSPNYTDAQLNSGDSIQCILTSNAPCRQLDKVISNELMIQIPELISEGTCGEASLTLNDLPYTEIRWKKNGEYIDNPVPSNRGGGVTVAGNLGGTILENGSIFTDEANAVYVSSNKGILKIGANGDERIVIPVTQRYFFRTRKGSFYIPYEDRVEKWEIGETAGTVVAGGNGVGSNPNQLSITPLSLPSVQVTEAGIIYILDRGNNRIQRWNPGASEGVTIAQGDKVGSVFFVDVGGNLFTASEGTIYKWPVNTQTPVSTYSYQNLESGAIALDMKGDSKGNLYPLIYNSSDRNTNTYRMNANSIVKLFSTYGLNTYDGYAALGLSIASNNNIYINTSAPSCCDGIFKWNSSTGLINIRDRVFSNETNMVAPKDVFVSGRGDIYTWNNDKIQKWSPGSKEGITVAGGNGLGSASNQLNFASDVAVDKDGNVYVADKNNHRVQRWSPGSSSGTTVAGGNGLGTAANQLNFPGKIFLDESKTLFIADNSRIQKWSNNAVNGITVVNQSSKYIFVKEDTIYAAGKKWGPGASSGISYCGLNNLTYNDVHLDNQKNYVYSFFGQYKNSVYDAMVRKWSPTNQISNNCIPGTIDTLIQGGTPTGVFIDSLNNLYVADTQRKKIQKYLATAPTLAAITSGQYTAEVTIGARTLTLSATPGTNTLGLCESTGSGDWSNATTWTCGRIPLTCDQVVINEDHTVSLSEAVQISGLEIRQNGNLSLMGGNVQIAKP